MSLLAFPAPFSFEDGTSQLLQPRLLNAAAGLGGSSSSNCTTSATSIDMSDSEIAARILLSLVLLGLSALFSGLTLGLLSLDPTELQIVKTAGSPKERKNAETILKVREQGNLLLCVLLLGNAGTNSLLSIILADLTSGLAGFFISTFLILIFGEVVPQSACSRHALSIGALFVPLVQLFIFLTYPLSKPLSMVLDWALGEEVGLSFSRKEFKALLEMHAKSNKLEEREVAVMSSVIDFRSKKAKDVMTTADRLFSLRADERLDYATIARIYRSGFSRVPVWTPDEASVIGLLYAKDLMLLEPRTRTPVATVLAFFGRSHVNTVDEEDSLDSVLRLFGSSHQHFAIVKRGQLVVGVVTLEDATEALIAENISDEYDAFRPGRSEEKWERQQQQQLQLAQQRRARGDSTMGAGGPLVSAATTGFGATPSQSFSSATRTASSGSDTFFGGGGLSLLSEAEREKRIDAAIRRLHAVTGSDLDPIQLGRGNNNFLTPAEIAGLAAHLVTNTRAFKLTGLGASSSADGAPSGSEGGKAMKKRKSLAAMKVDMKAGAASNPTANAASMRLDHDGCLEELDRAFDLDVVKSLILLSPVVDLVAPVPHLPRGAFDPLRLSNGGKAADGTGRAGAQVDPTTFGEDYSSSILGGTVAAVAAARAESFLASHERPQHQGQKHSLQSQTQQPRKSNSSDIGISVPATSSFSTTAPSSSSVTGLQRIDTDSDSDSDDEENGSRRWLIRKGDQLNACLIVLEGDVEVVCGKDNISALKGSFDVIAERALMRPEGTYRADFRLRPLSSVVRALRIDRKLFDLARLQAARRNRAVLDEITGVASASTLSSPAVTPRGGDEGHAAATWSMPPSLTLPPHTYRHPAPTVPDLRADLSNVGDLRTALDDSSAGGASEKEFVGIGNGGNGGGDGSSVISSSSSSAASSVDQWLAERGTSALPPSPFSATAARAFGQEQASTKYLQHDRRSPVFGAGSGGGAAGAPPSPVSISVRAASSSASFAGNAANKEASRQDKGLLPPKSDEW